MALRPVTIRFDPEIYEFVGQEASRLGVSVAEYVRAAALARAAFSLARRAPEQLESWEALYDQALAIAEQVASEGGPG